MSTGDGQAPGFAGELFVPLRTRGEGVGEVVGLRTVEVVSEVVGGTEVDVGREVRVGPGFGVLRVRPPNKKLSGFAEIGQLGQTSPYYRARNVKRTVESVAAVVIGDIAEAPASA